MSVCETCKYADYFLEHQKCFYCYVCSTHPRWEPKDAPVPPVDDILNSPQHYTGRGGIEPMEFIISNNMNWLEGNIVKYVYRYPFKGGVESLKKARVCLDKLIEGLKNAE